MELNLVSKEKKTVVIELTDVKETIVHPLIDRLLSDKDVLLAAYKTGHPRLDVPRLTVKTQRVNPETAVKKAADGLTDEIKTLKKEFDKALKRPVGKKSKISKPKKPKAEKPKAKAAKKEAPKKAKKPAPKKTKTPAKKSKSTAAKGGKKKTKKSK